MVEIRKDRKSPTWIVTKTDNEGFHRQINLTADEMDDLVRLWQNEGKEGASPSQV